VTYAVSLLAAWRQARWYEGPSNVLAVGGGCDAARERSEVELRMHEECLGVLVLLELIDNVTI
jgi:hypothetical protein